MPSNPLRAALRRPAVYRASLKLGALTNWTERVLRKLSRNRIGALDVLGLPSIQLVVRGRHSGILRTIPLQSVADGDVLLLVASNWGSRRHPAWSANLMAAREVTVLQRGERFTASVRVLTDAERARAWQRALQLWPNYELAQRIAGREFRIFALKRTEWNAGNSHE